MRVVIATGACEFSIEVGYKETILQLKQKIEQLLGVPVASQTLAVCEWELMDGLDMEDYPIVVDGTRIHLTIAPIEYPVETCSKIQITVIMAAKRIKIEVDRTETVRSLKEKIHIVEGCAIKRMALYLAGVEMDEDLRCLREYGISNQSEVVVLSRQMIEPPAGKELINLVVQTCSLLNSATIALEMKESSTVRELRRLLLDGKFLPADDYFFIHKQRIMRDDCSLRWHGVEDGDYLYVFNGTVSRSH
ncbi:PREDICTED: uncharacterized protein LOC104604989 [Nelumbo nucifera]|uniref:Ubiquitin-like domain-containing protein n=2 Tax=Nelumbo nucifera TaxID=4432 RepID=A0A822XNU8_NELNU|nr:PREDICTED: uncharacterized protein LOC104604989 [Nelumbo nucifera]DAD23284.1 TPA_asm: hypothetical protein HUJ06_024747 [Nelumbo nucifera]